MKSEPTTKQIKEPIVECPWPESVWPMTDVEYVKAVPEPGKRTAISGFLMRKGWEIALNQVEEKLGVSDPAEALRLAREALEAELSHRNGTYMADVEGARKALAALTPTP
jgi:hypothetical protein